ncbi:MAG: C25 family cysteine peptidase [Thermoguttaceae bacterium]
MPKIFTTVLVLLLLTTTASAFGDVARNADVGDIILVCPPPLESVMQSWIARRAAQGRGVHLVTEFTDAASICRTIRQIVATSVTPPTAVVLAGEVPLVPTCYVAADVILRYTKDTMIATDNGFGDIDDDGVPDLAVGRLSASTPEEMTAIVEKIALYETSLPNGPWLRKMHIVAGVGGFSPLLDGVIEASSRYVLESLVPPAYNVSMTMADWRSAYCPDPLLLRAMTLDRLNEGGLFWLYMGHGYRKGLDMLRTPVGEFPILVQGDAQYIQCREGLPIAVFFACHTGAIDCDGVSLAEDLFRRPRGPIACIAASRVTMPYGEACFGTELAERVMNDRPATLGRLVLDSKRGMTLGWKKKSSSPTTKPTMRPIRDVLDSTTKMFDPTSPQERQRREHVAMFNLIGDPTLLLPRPIPMTLSVTKHGGTLQVDGILERPINGSVIVECARREGRGGNVRTTFEFSESSRESYQETYAAANETVISRVVTQCDAGQFRTAIPAPPAETSPRELRQMCVRVFVFGDDGFTLADHILGE